MERNVWRMQNKINACSIPMVDPQLLASTNVAELVPPEIRHRNRQTDTNRDLDYTYIGAKDRVEWTLGKPRSPSRIVCCLAGARQQ